MPEPDDKNPLDEVLPQHIALSYRKESKPYKYGLSHVFFNRKCVRQESDRLLSSYIQRKIPFIDSNRLLKRAKLGRGSFGVVYSGTLDNQSVAIKQQKKWVDFVDEVTIQYDVKHDNIVLLIGICTTSLYSCIVFELMDQSLADLLLNNRVSLDEKERQHIGRQIASALNYLHEKKIIHQDIKIDNVLVRALNQHYEAKLGDLGLARLLNQTNCYGDIRYQAPEVLKYHRQSPASDVYSYGFVLLAIEARQRVNAPYSGIPRGTPDKMGQLIRSCCNEEAEKRPSAQEIENELVNAISFVSI